jgi:prepilin-type N-terminal cleavage/methylation domain-containing protein
MKKLTGFTLIELLVVCAIIAILAGLVLGAGGGCSRSSGTRVGTITKFSYKGIWKSTKSWEGDMAMEGIATGEDGKTMANVWHFSVLDPKMATNIEALVGKKVKARYEESFARNPLRRSTRYLVISVEEIGAKPKLEQ